MIGKCINILMKLNFSVLKNMYSFWPTSLHLVSVCTVFLSDYSLDKWAQLILQTLTYITCMPS